MADSAFAQRLARATVDRSEAPRHSAVMRITHWITAVGFLGLLVSGVAILISHPRLYWGETGNWETPSLVDLPLPFVLAGQNGWGRSLHFLAAWVCVLTGLLYLIWGVVSRHFRRDLLPARSDLAWHSIARAIRSHVRFERPGADASLSYNVLQRLAYVAVIFGLFPLAIWTGLAMSPAITSVFPALVTVWGGQQSARTIHFFVSVLLLSFVLVHVVMVFVAGFRGRMRAMITGYAAARKEHV
jgi:thiosulfate reductase cytochrome b subunit